MKVHPFGTAPRATDADIERARSVMEKIEGWVGWELWDLDRESIRLDGDFTPDQLLALWVVLSNESHPPSPGKT